MKHLLLLFFIIINLSPSQSVFSLNNEENSSPVIIDVYNEDITGDGIQETIELKGILLSKDSAFFHNIWADITNEHFGKWRINYGGGYHPKLQITDLNLNHKATLLFRSASDESKGTFKHHLHSIKNNKIVELKLPKRKLKTGNFKDNFKIEIETSTHNRPITFLITDNKSNYIEQGIYNGSGQLITNKPIKTNSSSFFEPFFISTSKGYGLKSFQQLNDTNNHPISTLETIWYFENNKWVILQEGVIDVINP